MNSTQQKPVTPDVLTGRHYSFSVEKVPILLVATLSAILMLLPATIFLVIAILLVVTPRFILALNNSEHLLLDGNVLLARVDVK